jgi:hypothetical protein
VSQFVLDEQLHVVDVLAALRRWGKCQLPHDLRPGQRVLDDRVPEILRDFNQPTFLTIDQGFWDARYCHPGYCCILYFAFRDDQQGRIPGLLRALRRRPEFRTRAGRMGKVVRVSPVSIEYYQFPGSDLHRITWEGAARKRRGG